LSHPVEGPQDDRVSRRWFLERMAWVSSMAVGGAVLDARDLGATGRTPGMPVEAYARDVALQSVDDLTELTLSESMTLVRNGTVSPEELAAAHVDRIERFDHAYQAYAARPTREALLAEAGRTPADGIDAPLTECLADVVARFLPYWESRVLPDLRSGKVVMLAAHGNSLRALIKYLDGVSDADIAGLNIPTGIPLVYELDEGFVPTTPGGCYLDPDAAQEAIAGVAAQGR